VFQKWCIHLMIEISNISSLDNTLDKNFFIFNGKQFKSYNNSENKAKIPWKLSLKALFSEDDFIVDICYTFVHIYLKWE
jgi:hypothetical protein